MARKKFLVWLFMVAATAVLAACSTPSSELSPAAPTQTGSIAAATATTPATAKPLPETSKPPDGWTKYTNEPYGFTFDYPGKWEMCGESKEVIRLCMPMTEPGVGPQPSFYVAVIPAGQELSGLDFMTAQAVRNYLSLPVGESALTEPNAVVPEYSSYTRLPDITIAGLLAAVIENQTIWEAPEEIVDRRALLETEAGLISIGSYYASPEELKTYEQILETFEFK